MLCRVRHVEQIRLRRHYGSVPPPAPRKHDARLCARDAGRASLALCADAGGSPPTPSFMWGLLPSCRGVGNKAFPAF